MCGWARARLKNVISLLAHIITTRPNAEHSFSSKVAQWPVMTARYGISAVRDHFRRFLHRRVWKSGSLVGRNSGIFAAIIIAIKNRDGA